MRRKGDGRMTALDLVLINSTQQSSICLVSDLHDNIEEKACCVAGCEVEQSAPKKHFCVLPRDIKAYAGLEELDD